MRNKSAIRKKVKYTRTLKAKKIKLTFLSKGMLLGVWERKVAIKDIEKGATWDENRELLVGERSIEESLVIKIITSLTNSLLTITALN